MNTRRGFLKLSGAALLALAAPGFWPTPAEDRLQLLIDTASGPNLVIPSGHYTVREQVRITGFDNVHIRDVVIRTDVWPPIFVYDVNYLLVSHLTVRPLLLEQWEVLA